MDFDDGCCFLENNFGHFQSMISSDNSELDFDNVTDESNDRLADMIDNFGFDLNSNSDILATNDSSILGGITFDNDFMSQIFYDNGSPSTSDSGNYSPTCSTSDDQSASDSDRILFTAQGAQTTLTPQLEKKTIAVPNPSHLVPVRIPIQQIVANTKNTPNHPVICIMPAVTHASSVSSQQLVNQTKRMLSPKYEIPLSVPTFTACAKDYDRKKEDRKIRNRYSAQLSRIRKKNEIDEMKRNLTNKDVIIGKLRSEIESLKGTIEILRRENEMLKTSANNRNSGSRLGIVAGAACLFGFISNLDPVRDATGLVAVNLAKPNVFSLEDGPNIGRTLLSLDYDGNKDYASKENSLSNKKSDVLSQSNLNYSGNCDNTQKKYLNQTETIRLNNDVFEWINRHECLQFMHIRRIFRVPLHNKWSTPNMTKKSSNALLGRVDRESFRLKTAVDKMEAARLKAIRERAWRHIDMISSSTDNAAIKSQVKTMDYDVISHDDLMTNWLQHKTNALPPMDMESQYAELARNLKQREDTLYIIAMKNYYLLPATHKNSTMQPRMALILPALSFNGTLPNQVAMMRLECDITGTGLFHLPSSLLPLFYEHSNRQ
uniref:BZIP domain-containing protein n=1 Tax=Setaria digitata TaxID=48799 RepID=A0A915PSA5_9BILA